MVGVPYCPKCGGNLLETDRVCLDCGHDLWKRGVAEGEARRRREMAARAEAAARRAEERDERTVARATLEDAKRQDDDRRMQALYAVDTGRGKCPKCGSTNTGTVRRDESDTGAQAAFAGCMCCCIAWPLAILAPFLFKSKVTNGYCVCCQHEWPL